MPTTREKLIDWLADLPDNTEIGIEDIYLVAIIGSKSQSFEVGDLSDESVQRNLEWFMGLRKEMMARMVEIHEEFAGVDTAEGVIVATLEGYISGVPEFFTKDVMEAFCFKDRKQAEDFIAEFADALHNPQVLDHP
jgi:hypothetical protein